MAETKKSKIIKQAQAAPAIVVNVGRSHLNGFMDFIRNQGVVGLAIGLVLGGSVSVLVTSLVNNVVMPPLGLLLGSADGLKGLGWTIGTTPDGTPAVLHYGIFLNDLINFIVIAFVVYAVISILKLDKLDKKKDK